MPCSRWSTTSTIWAARSAAPEGSATPVAEDRSGRMVESDPAENGVDEVDGHRHRDQLREAGQRRGVVVAELRAGIEVDLDRHRWTVPVGVEGDDDAGLGGVARVVVDRVEATGCATRTGCATGTEEQDQRLVDGQTEVLHRRGRKPQAHGVRAHRDPNDPRVAGVSRNPEGDAV